MTIRLNPYLSFDGNARAAMEFYQSVFGGELRMSTFGDYGAPEGADPDGIMHASIDAENIVLMGSDTPPDSAYKPCENFAISLSGPAGDGDKLREYWEKLSGNGAVIVPLEKQMWGDEFGMCTDSFAIRWMVNIGQ